jgi:hypothetical protein
MSHVTFKRGNRGDSWLLMIRNQIANLTPSPSFGHNLCFRCLNGSCEPIFNIYIPRNFQWYTELLNLLSFNPWNCSLKIRESTETPTPKVEATLEGWGFIPSHFPTLLGACGVTPGLPFQPTTLHAFTLVANPMQGYNTNSQNGSSFGSVEVQSLTFSYTPGSMRCDSRTSFWFTPLQALALVASPRLRLRQSSSDSSMNTRSINVTPNLVYYFSCKLLLLMWKNSTIDVLVLYISWIIVCTNCISSLYIFPSTHFEDDDECNGDLIPNY